jgi:hypothetical protein
VSICSIVMPVHAYDGISYMTNINGGFDIIGNGCIYASESNLSGFNSAKKPFFRCMIVGIDA